MQQRKETTMLKPNILEGLNSQLNEELYAAYVYLSMSAWFETQNLTGFAHWMRMQAQEEVTHAMKLYTYIIDKRGELAFKSIKEPKGQWGSPVDALEQAYKHECQVSESINHLVTLAMQEEDHATRVFLQWFVSEQVEEEAVADSLLQKLKLVAEYPAGLFMIDNELGNRTLTSAGDK
jgi:ferritin